MGRKKTSLKPQEPDESVRARPEDAPAAPTTHAAWDYSEALESTAHLRLEPRYALFIGGKWCAPASRRYFPTLNPASEEPLAEVAEAGAHDVDVAVRAARVGYERYWSRLTPLERGKYIFRLARAIQERAQDLAIVESMDSGKPIRAARDVDLPLASSHFFYHAGWADKLSYICPGRTHRALGVAAQIVPWNFPLLMAAWKLAPALATGNTCVLKPAETTPLTALLLGKIVEECDLPPGVVNIVTGGGGTGAALVQHPGVDKVAFTGSTEVGKLIARAVAGTRKRLTLELGGKSAHIVFADAAIDQAIEAVVAGTFFNQGEVCGAGSRLLVEESVLGVVLDKLRDRMSRLIVGNPLDKNTDVGAINSREQLRRIEELVVSGERSGATRYSVPCILPLRGYWFPPTVFSTVAASDRIACEEIFGPVLIVMTFRTPAEAVEKANNTMYGLSAGVWTEKASKSHWMAERLRAGVIWTNTYNKFDPASPFGGYKQSGFGREGGRQGLLAYLEVT